MDRIEVGLELGKVGFQVFRLVKRGKIEGGKAGVDLVCPVGGGFKFAVNEPALPEVFLVLRLADRAIDQSSLQRFGLSDGVLGGCACLKSGHHSLRAGGRHFAQLPMMSPGIKSQRIPLARKRATTMRPAAFPYLAKRLRMRAENMTLSWSGLELRQGEGDREPRESSEIYRLVRPS